MMIQKHIKKFRRHKKVGPAFEQMRCLLCDIAAIWTIASPFIPKFHLILGSWAVLFIIVRVIDYVAEV